MSKTYEELVQAAEELELRMDTTENKEEYWTLMDRLDRIYAKIDAIEAEDER